MTTPLNRALAVAESRVVTPRYPTIDIIPVSPPGAALRAMLGDGIGQLTRPNFGWSFVARPRQGAGTEWSGVDGWTLRVPIVFDHFRTDGSVEADVRRLYEMASNRVGPRVEPPVVRVFYPGVPFPEFRYVINEISPTDTKVRVDGQRSYAAFDVAFLQYNALDVLTTKKATPAKKAKAKTPASKAKVAKARTYTVKRGDTLAVIAARVGVPKWQTIATLNKIRDPKAVKVGQVLRLP